jgi:putative PIN family toxin of toxin-antitoxin system
MTRVYQVVIDTNVLVSALRSNLGASYKLLTLLGDVRWQINLSVSLALEYEAVLTRERSQLSLSTGEIGQIVDSLCAIANQQDIFYLWRPGSKDPDDEFLIELAVAAQADFILSYNRVDLRQSLFFGIEVLSPKQFLQLLGELP